jgi:cytochrome oxidase Cu insertion factor (SCO1/SenC/PrrC family)
MVRLSFAVVAFTLIAGATGASEHDARSHSSTRASFGPSAGYAFRLPQPGSYALPPIKAAAGGRVLDENGHARELRNVVRGRITVLAFIYTRCGDVCPAATLQIAALQDLAAREPDISKRMHLVSMSFDPDPDTPEVMSEHAAHWRSKELAAPDWKFLTAPGTDALAPILAAYDQTVAPKQDAKAPTGPLHHIFRAFLIDRAGAIRNIYSLDFLDPELVMADVKSLLIEEKLIESPATARP